jgi:uncharacterized protein YecE (DUF72 family)
MGWSYDDWKGPFYAQKARSRDFLAAYAEHFDTVEVDSSWYGMPRRETIDRWCKVTPDAFRFALKCPQEITHESQLTGVELSVPMLCESVRRFGAKLGMVLFQFPRSFQAQHVVRLKRLFDLLPRELPFAVEFRHESWLAVGAPELAREYGVTWTVTDLLPEMHATTDTLYLRLLGDHNLDVPFKEVILDVDREVEEWGRQLLELPPRVTSVLGYVNNHYSGYSPATASRLRTLLGLPPITIRRQASLFD